ncbi:MAG: hypothetical protein GYA52_03075 [Chloroflexi bacterium]|nr:hypothetical protein [Chloroflexota bacterium]
MNTEFLNVFDTLPYFTIEAVKQLIGDENMAAGTIPTALYRWMKEGHIYQLKRGVYMTHRFYELHRSDADFAPAVSAILIPQSYVSLDYILQRYGILTEITYPVTAITLKHTRVIENKMGTFTYRNIKQALYSGFIIMQYMGIPFSQATVAKALFDYLYLRPSLSYDLVEDLRLNLDDRSQDEQEEFAEIVAASKSRKMDRVLNHLRKTVWQH